MGCQTYQYASNVRLISFDDDLTVGKSAGPVEGKDCVWRVLGRWLGSAPTLDSAFQRAATQKSSNIMSDTIGDTGSANGNAIRYMNDVRTEWDGFDAWVIGQRCLVVKGKGYR